MRVFFISRGHVVLYAHIWAFVTSISHMGEMRDSDWSRQNLLRSDWLPPSVALYTTNILSYNSGHLSGSGKQTNGNLLLPLNDCLEHAL